MKHTKLVFAIPLLFGMVLAQAAPSYEPVLQSFEALGKAKDQEFKGIKDADIKRMREEFRGRSETALSVAKSEYAALARGKSDQDMDKLLWARMEKAGVDGKIGNEIKAMGGPAKAMQQSDRIVKGFVQDVLDDSRPQVKLSLAETVVTALVMAQPAQARMGSARRGACYAFWFVLTVGYGTQHAYTSCDR